MRWMKHHWLALMPLLFVLLASCSSSAVSTPKPTASEGRTAPQTPSRALVLTPTPSPTIGPVPTAPRSEIAPMPTNCPLVSPPETKIFPQGWGGFLQDATLIGHSPVWAGMSQEVQVYTGTGNYAVRWTGTKILWEVGPDFTQSVTIQVKNLATGVPAWWGKGDQPPSEPLLVLDSRNEGYHGPPASGWYEWGSFLYLLAAGCYSMDVSWPGGAWHMVFAAGR